jgi:hypothetical protein
MLLCVALVLATVVLADAGLVDLTPILEYKLPLSLLLAEPE